MTPTPPERPQPVRTDESNAFANHTMRVRVPAILQEVSLQNPDYPAAIQQAILQLADELQHNDPLRPITPYRYGAPDWLQALEAHPGATWQNTEWFFAETYLYRYLMDIVDWWHTARDPFAPRKHEELHSAALWDTLDAALPLSHNDQLPVDEKLGALLHYDLWGNRIDLSYALAASHGSAGSTDDLLVDDTERIVRHLLSIKAGTVDLILDNAGTELATDLVLVDALLKAGIERVRLHVKYHPTFVSDTTQYDLLTFLTRLHFDHNQDRRQLSDRLALAFFEGRLEVRPDIFWNSSRFMGQLSPENPLAALLHRSALLIFKGDANYRRLVDDAMWDEGAVFDTAVNYFKVPVAALRTMKSDPLVGLPGGRAGQLDGLDSQWRVNGRRGVIQFASPANASDLNK